MKTLTVNDYDMAYLDMGEGPPLVCVHGSLNDFRAWAAVMGPLSAKNRLIIPSLRHYFPEHWDGKGGKFNMAQHVDDMIAFIEALGLGKVDLIGHSRGGHLAFRLALKRPDLIRKLLAATPAPEDDTDYRVFYNINFPPVLAEAVRGVRVAPQGFRRNTRFSVEPHLSPSGRRFLWIKGGEQHVPTLPGTDAAVNLDGYISVTPMRADLTAHDLLDQLKGIE